jgi:cupin superfamily acireductone dioxygenase involved in methionine salvage
MNNIVDDWSENLDKEESDNIEEMFINFSFEHSVEPPPYMQERILSKIEALYKASQSRNLITAENLPFLDQTSNWMDWNDFVKHIEPPSEYEELHLHPICDTEERELSVVWIRTFAEEEGHHDFEESILMLEGRCDCKMTDEMGNSNIVSMTVGDYFIIPKGQHHSMTTTSKDPIKFILQRKMLRA